MTHSRILNDPDVDHITGWGECEVDRSVRRGDARQLGYRSARQDAVVGAGSIRAEIAVAVGTARDLAATVGALSGAGSRAAANDVLRDLVTRHDRYLFHVVGRGL